MKIIVSLFIMLFFGGIGYYFKLRQKREVEFFNYLYDYANFCKSNISLFKNNMVNITENYIITQKNKNANYNNIFEKSGLIYQISRNSVEKYIEDKKECEIVYNFLNGIGGNDYEFERKRIDYFLNYVNDKKNNDFEKRLKDADLKFKIFLAIGAVVCIVIW